MRRRFRDISINRKLMWIIMLTTSIALLLAGSAFIAYEIVASRRTMPEEVTALADMIGINSQAALSFQYPDDAAKNLRSLRPHEHIVSACIYTTNGVVLARYQSRDDALAFVPPPVEPKGHRFENEHLIVFHPVLLDDELIGTVYLRASMLRLHARVKRYTAIGGSTLVACSLVALVLSARLRRVVSSPILELASAAATVATEKNYSVRVAARGDDELGQLVAGFNNMLTQIQSRDAALQQAHDELEKRVSQRTQELSTANQLLKQQIAERLQAEEEQQKLAALVQNSRDFIGMATLDGRAFFLNEAGRRIIGMDPQEDLLGTAIESCFPEESRSQLREVILPTVLNTGLWEGETQLRHFVSGQKVPVYMSAFLVKHPQTGVPICLATVTRDITEHLNLEARLRQSQKMEAVGQLAAGVAHDFNNILTIIQAYTNLLQGSGQWRGDEIEYLKEISDAAQRAANLTRQLLTFSRRQVMQARLTDLNEVVSQVTKMLHRILGEHISLQFNYSPKLAAIHADVSMIEQIIINLAVNARDAMPNGGHLIISTESHEIQELYVHLHPESRTGQFVCLSMADTGCGMDQGTLSRVFEPFFTTKEVGKGTGLGLATVYGIVKQHQGWIEVESQPGHGSTFRVFLPAQQSKRIEPSQETRVHEERLGGGETIFLVEDEPAIRHLAKRILEHYGYRVVEAANGVEALARWKDYSEHIDLLVTDMIMPQGINGRDLAERLQAQDRTLKVIYTSGYSPDTVAKELLLREGGNFLAKPYHPKVLVKMVRDALDAKLASAPVHMPAALARGAHDQRFGAPS
jgi:PAS domain S-box-containing protein